MADRVLVWYLDNIVGDGLEQGPIYFMDRDYVPSGLRVMVKRVADAADLTFSIKDDGTTILARTGRVRKGDKTEPDADEFAPNPAVIRKDSLVSLDVTPSGAKGMTIQLELDAVE